MSYSAPILWPEIQLRKFDVDRMIGRKNERWRLDALAELLRQPISDELVDHQRKVRLAALFEGSGASPHPAWRIMIRQPAFEYYVEDYQCPGGKCGHSSYGGG